MTPRVMKQALSLSNICCQEMRIDTQATSFGSCSIKHCWGILLL